MATPKPRPLGVDRPHDAYKAYLPVWKRCRDCIRGEDAIKEKSNDGTYLPKLEGQSEDDYNAYKLRALFYNAGKRTKQAISGAIFRKAPAIDPPSEYIEQRARDMMGQVLDVGRVGVMVDAPQQGGDPYIVVYRAEQIINWRYETVNDDKVLTQIVLEEKYTEKSDTDEFATLNKVRWRVLDLDGGIYRVRTFEQTISGRNNEATITPGFEVIPTARGQPLRFIPFYLCSAESLDPDIDEPPLLDLINVNLSHYRSSADLEHGRHFTALPTAWIAGFDAETEYKIGAATAWVTENVQARAGFLEFTGAGLGALENALASKEHLMAVLGARLFENAKQGIEAAETVRLRQSADTATAAGMARLVGQCLTAAYQTMLDMTVTGGTAKVEVNADILDIGLDAGTITALVAAYQGGTMSLDTLLWNFQQGELLPPGQTVEDEKQKIEVDQSNLAQRSANNAFLTTSASAEAMAQYAPEPAPAAKPAPAPARKANGKSKPTH